MNGFADKGLDEGNFGENQAIKAVRAFDAFPKTKPSYTQKTNNGGIWTVVLVCASLWLAWTEVMRWWWGHTTHEFSVEQGVGHDLQINLDVVVKMRCDDLHVNVQDASGDRILAGETLQRDATLWSQWGANRKLHTLGATRDERLEMTGYSSYGDAREYAEDDVHDYLGAASSTKKFKKTPRVPKSKEADSCRIYGSMHGNKVQGDFHITARGHGYMEFGQHLEHSSFNFSHHINELSFGPFYPSLTNPLDNTLAATEFNFFKFQYYLSVVPTIYTTNAKALRKITKSTVFTNQYAVTEQSRPVPENQVPGVFVKYDIEPILLMIAEERNSFPALFIRLVNVISGVLVAGGWCFQISEWAREVYGRRRGGRQDSFGMLTPMDEKKGSL
ncbi:hypothetical protein BAUCODRAFT_120300 [Baudoinia panamericana UAMH 10762]|uniref:Endoplasmic reticulum-Golgi intermediate compartment protein n=1 Tax=Baudoinia panamericana (strain UAMH 10762) TaxID=717646 RepID=M2NIV2_BAUPA|nr:uncharacterized protein BAUCODRAFT_120300 [Baudoinia panamericana UAMH 10762]EMC99010.1 hypothetical protein BAUCODRAFT_120300 [Baudoinia panamericana UAMH 10762]